MKRDLTVCLAFYSNPGMLAHQLAHFAALPSPVRKHVRLIVVDDGSPVPAEIVRPEALGFPVALYRMQLDIPWNQDACRNLAVAEAQTEWVLLTDMDHLAPVETLQWAIGAKLDPTVVYTFERVTAPAMEPYKPHPNSWLMTCDMYDQVGGYDERYAGIYGTDGPFMSRVHETARKVLRRPHVLIRCPREYIADASTTTLERKSEANTARKKAIDAEIQGRVEELRRPVRGRFPWARVL